MRVLEAHLENLRLTPNALKFIHQQSAEIETPPGLEDARRFQMFPLDHGRAFYAFNIAWYQTLLKTLKMEN